MSMLGRVCWDSVGGCGKEHARGGLGEEHARGGLGEERDGAWQGARERGRGEAHVRGDLGEGHIRTRGGVAGRSARGAMGVQVQMPWGSVVSSPHDQYASSLSRAPCLSRVASQHGRVGCLWH